MLRQARVAPRVLGLALLAGGKAVDSVSAPLNREERALVEFLVWSDSVTFLRVEDAFFREQPVSFVLVSLARLGPPSAALCASLASKKLQRSSGLVTRGVKDVLNDWQINGSLREATNVCVCVCAPRSPRSAGVPQVAERVAVVFCLEG